MTLFVRYHAASGHITGHQEDDGAAPTPGEGEAVIEVASGTPAAAEDWWVDDGALEPRTPISSSPFIVTTADPDVYQFPPEAWFRLQQGNAGTPGEITQALDLTDGDNFVELVGQYRGAIRLNVASLAARKERLREVARSDYDASLPSVCATGKGDMLVDVDFFNFVTATVVWADKLVAAGGTFPGVRFPLADGSVVEHDHAELDALGLVLGAWVATQRYTPLMDRFEQIDAMDSGQ